jgi:pullanase-associated domain-containing protein
MKKLMSLVTLIFLASVLTACGGNSEKTAVVETPLWCKSPETINDAGTACELVITPCNYPEVANPDTQLCEMDRGEWRPGANGIDMPQPVYTAGANEVVYYYQLTSGDYTDWGLHAWNNDDCNSYADFDRPIGGTSWTAPLAPTGIDPNFGAYWVMNIIEAPNCAYLIPHNLETSTQTADLRVELATAETNPTGSFFILEGFEEDYIFPYPRTFASLVVPGGATLTCEAPLIINEAGDECITDPSIVATFVPGESVLYLKGEFNGWFGEATDDDLKTYNFNYVEATSTYVMATSLTAGTYSFKVADIDWSDATSFGTATGEEEVVIGEAKTLTVTDGQNISITVAADGNYQFSFDASDPENPVLTVTEVSLGKVMYVKGSINGWANTSPMVYEGNNIYTSVYSLAAGDFEFKVADDDWSDPTNFGASVGDLVQELDVAKTLVQGRDEAGDPLAQNISLTIASDGSYKFTLDTTDPQAPILTVSNAIPFGNAVMFLKGTMNGWGGVADGFEFSYADNHYTLIATLTPNTDDNGDIIAHSFKISDPTWADGSTVGSVDGDGALVVGEARTMTLPGANIDLLVSSETLYKFDLDATNKAAPILTVTEHVPFAGRAMYLKGAMNGWSTNEDYLLSYADNTFTLITSIPAGSYEFKIASDGWEDDSTIGALPDSGVVTVAEALTVATKTNGGADNLSLEVPVDTLYKFVVDTSDAAAVTLTVTEHVPFAGRDIFLKGSMNGWSTDAAYQFTNVAGTYTLEATLAAGSQEFKIASDGWEDDSTIGGFTDNTVVTVDVPLDVAVKTEGGENNLTFEATAATYIFTIDATGSGNNSLTISLKP